MPACGGLLESKGSGLAMLKSTFNAENYTGKLSWSTVSHFGAIHSENVLQLEIAKISLKPLILEVQSRPRSSMLIPL